MPDIVYTNAWQHYRKLVTTKSPKNILRAQAEFEAMTESLEQGVACLVTKSIIY